MRGRGARSTQTTPEQQQSHKYDPTQHTTTTPPHQATFLYGGLLRELAHQQISDALGLAAPAAQALEGDARAAALVEAAALLRQAAGVFGALAEKLLPGLVGLKPDR